MAAERLKMGNWDQQSEIFPAGGGTANTTP